MSKYVGESEEIVRKLFADAESAFQKTNLARGHAGDGYDKK
jgi:SpoVK/Ycf46/Vps4 family AAA+-type ATPase